MTLEQLQKKASEQQILIERVGKEYWVTHPKSVIIRKYLGSPIALAEHLNLV